MFVKIWLQNYRLNVLQVSFILKVAMAWVCSWLWSENVMIDETQLSMLPGVLTSLPHHLQYYKWYDFHSKTRGYNRFLFFIFHSDPIYFINSFNYKYQLIKLDIVCKINWIRMKTSEKILHTVDLIRR